LLFLIPFMAVIIFFALPYVARSWSVLERSREMSGLPFVYLLKTLVPLFAVLMGLQGISQTIHAAGALSARRSSAAAGDRAGRGDGGS
jgi:TRAP-type mannitol/chloroaromatic compound transport system permease small subunit